MATDVLQQASDWFENQRSRHAASPVEYVRGEESVELPATVGKTTFEVDDGCGVLIRHESRDFLVLAAELILAGQTTTPQRGDRIRQTQEDRVFVHEVIAPGREPCWRWSDPYRQTLRIHTKLFDTETLP